MTHFFTLLIALSMTMTFFGKSIVGIGLGLTVIFSCAIMVKNKALPDFKSAIMARETIAILAMIGAWFISAYHGIKPEKSMGEVAEYAGIILGGYIIFAGVRHVDFDFRKLFQITTALATGCALYLSLTPFLGEYAVKWGSSYGSVLTFFAPMAFYLAMTTTDNKKYIWWACLLVLVSAIFASGGRTAWLTLIAIAPMLAFFIPSIKRLTAIIMVVVTLGAGAFIGLESYKYNIGEEVFEVRTEAMTNMDRPASGRLTVWANTIDKIVDRPLLGYGIKSAQYLEISKGGDALVLHVHNVVLEMILETGVVGFAMFSIVLLIFVFKFLRAYLKSKDIHLKQQSMTIFMACVAYGICSMAVTSMFHAWWFLYLVVLLVFLQHAKTRLTQ